MIFLVLETRENTNAIQAQTYQNLTSDLNEVRRLAVSENILSIWQKNQSEGADALDPQERLSLLAVQQSMWGVYESAYYAQLRGILGDSEWARFEKAICRNRQLDDDLWGEPGQILALADDITPDFRQFVDSSCGTAKLSDD